MKILIDYLLPTFHIILLLLLSYCMRVNSKKETTEGKMQPTTTSNTPSTSSNVTQSINDSENTFSNFTPKSNTEETKEDLTADPGQTVPNFTPNSNIIEAEEEKTTKATDKKKNSKTTTQHTTTTKKNPLTTTHAKSTTTSTPSMQKDAKNKTSSKPTQKDAKNKTNSTPTEKNATSTTKSTPTESKTRPKSTQKDTKSKTSSATTSTTTNYVTPTKTDTISTTTTPLTIVILKKMETQRPFMHANRPLTEPKTLIIRTIEVRVETHRMIHEFKKLLQIVHESARKDFTLGTLKSKTRTMLFGEIRGMLSILKAILNSYKIEDILNSNDDENLVDNIKSAEDALDIVRVQYKRIDKHLYFLLNKNKKMAMKKLHSKEAKRKVNTTPQYQAFYGQPQYGNNVNWNQAGNLPPYQYDANAASKFYDWSNYAFQNSQQQNPGTEYPQMGNFQGQQVDFGNGLFDHLRVNEPTNYIEKRHGESHKKLKQRHHNKKHARPNYRYDINQGTVKTSKDDNQLHQQQNKIKNLEQQDSASLEGDENFNQPLGRSEYDVMKNSWQQRSDTENENTWQERLDTENSWQERSDTKNEQAGNAQKIHDGFENNQNKNIQRQETSNYFLQHRGYENKQAGHASPFDESSQLKPMQNSMYEDSKVMREEGSLGRNNGQRKSKKDIHSGYKIFNRPKHKHWASFVNKPTRSSKPKRHGVSKSKRLHRNYYRWFGKPNFKALRRP